MDVEGAAVTRVFLSSRGRFASLLGVALIVAATSAHIGTRESFFNGSAGPYALSVRVTPPDVVPGTAWVWVRASDTDVDSVAVRPVYWKAGERGAPPAERADTVPGQPGVYAQKVWLMSTGSYSVSVEVFGTRGHHSVSVPVMALATARLGLPVPYAAMLIVLAALLFAGLIAIVRAAASDSLVETDREPDQIARRRGSLAAIITMPLLLLAIVGGARWWRAEDASFARTIYRPLAADATVATSMRGYSLRVAVRDTGSQNLLRDPLMLDHGKQMHLFLVKEQSMSAFAHLHPTRDRNGVFVSAVPALPEGRYHVFADFVLETGAEYTATTMVEIPPAFVDTISDPDDSWTYAAFGVPATKGARSRLTPGLFLQWESGDSLVAGRAVNLEFTVRGPRNVILPVQPYLGMAGHAVVVREDASVFVHLHPMGSMSMAALQAFELRNRGDTTAEGRLVDAHDAMPMDSGSLPGRFSFPFAFPQPGRYRVWVQVKRSGRVYTGDYEVTVRAE
jgi:hypothetical protein